MSNISKSVTSAFFLLLESGGYLLQENNDKIIVGGQTDIVWSNQTKN